MFYVDKSLLHEALFGLSSESTSAHISTHSTTYSDGGRALRAAAGSRAAVTAIGGGRHTKATWLRRRHGPTASGGDRPRPNLWSGVAAPAARTDPQRLVHRLYCGLPVNIPKRSIVNDRKRYTQLKIPLLISGKRRKADRLLHQVGNVDLSSNHESRSLYKW